MYILQQIVRITIKNIWIHFVVPQNVITFALNFNILAMNELNRIKIVLVEKKKTGKWLADQLGVSVTTTSRWCSNAVQPDLSTLVKIASILDVDVKDLIISTKA